MSQRRTVTGRYSTDDNEYKQQLTDVSTGSTIGTSSSKNGVFEILDNTTLSLDKDDIDEDTDNINIPLDDVEAGLQEIQPLSSMNVNEQQINSTAVTTMATDRHKNRIRHWKESPFAVGLTEPTWIDERNRSTRLDDDSSGCLCCSAYVCPLLGASRVGNMAVLKSSIVTVDIVSDDIIIDENTGQQKHVIERVKRPQLDIVIGPYWPMLVFVTYPLILGVSGSALLTIYHNGLPILGIIVWSICTIGLIVSLAFTSCRDPGIVHRVRTIPKTNTNNNNNNGYPTSSSWRWTDQADSYRPRGAWYDMDTAVVVDGFDHTCPWTGTAIGKKNMLAFQMFVCLVFVCLVMDILILTGTLRQML